MQTVITHIPENNVLCAICLEEEDSRIGSNKKRLKCSHIFHEACIGKWLIQKPNCPICRASVKVKTCKASKSIMSNEEIPDVPGLENQPPVSHYDFIINLRVSPTASGGWNERFGEAMREEIARSANQRRMSHLNHREEPEHFECRIFYVNLQASTTLIKKIFNTTKSYFC